MRGAHGLSIFTFRRPVHGLVEARDSEWPECLYCLFGNRNLWLNRFLREWTQSLDKNWERLSSLCMHSASEWYTHTPFYTLTVFISYKTIRSDIVLNSVLSFALYSFVFTDSFQGAVRSTSSTSNMTQTPLTCASYSSLLQFLLRFYFA